MAHLDLIATLGLTDSTFLHSQPISPIIIQLLKISTSVSSPSFSLLGFGFGSRDPSRRDEFANALRAEQYKVAIRRENYFSPLPYLPTSPSQR